MTPNHKSKTRFLTGFFWLALLILFVGGAIALLLSVDKTNIDGRLTVRITLLLTGAGVALCAILGTSDWWLKR